MRLILTTTDLEDRLSALWRLYRPDQAGGSHHSHVGTASTDQWEQEKAQQFQASGASVPMVPAVPTESRQRREPGSGQGDGAAYAEWEERAAILEYDGGFSRAEAERRAKLELGSISRPPEHAGREACERQIQERSQGPSDR